MNAYTRAGPFLMALAALCGGGASAQAVYRCANNSYSQAPCEGGRQIQADDPRTPQQQAESQEATRRDTALADGMEQSRLQREAQAERDRATALRPVSAAGAPNLAEPPKPKVVPTHRPAVFVARVPGAKQRVKPRPKKKHD